MGKRGNDEGTITKRSDGRWASALWVGEGQERKRQWFYGPTRQDVDRQLKEVFKRRDSGVPAPRNARQTTGHYLTEWVRNLRTSGLRESTWLRYEQYVRVHAVPAIGKIPLTKLAPQDLQKLYADRQAAGKSPTTVHHLHTVLHHALKDAMRLDLVHRNVAELVDAPRLAEHERRYYSPEQARTLLNAIQGHRLEALITVALHTGMRLGELLALRWQDINLDGAYLTVQRGRQRTKVGFKDGAPKTKRGRRKIALNSHTVDVLREQQVKIEALRVKAGDLWEPNDLAFPSTIGTPLHPVPVRREYYALLEKADLPRIWIHELRHTFASNLLRLRENPKVVSEMLGHSTIAITLDIYSHVMPDMQAEAAAKIGDLFTGKKMPKDIPK